MVIKHSWATISSFISKVNNIFIRMFLVFSSVFAVLVSDFGSINFHRREACGLVIKESKTLAYSLLILIPSSILCILITPSRANDHKICLDGINEKNCCGFKWIMVVSHYSSVAVLLGSSLVQNIYHFLDGSDVLYFLTIIITIIQIVYFGGLYILYFFFARNEKYIDLGGKREGGIKREGGVKREGDVEVVGGEEEGEGGEREVEFNSLWGRCCPTCASIKAFNILVLVSELILLYGTLAINFLGFTLRDPCYINTCRTDYCSL